MKTLEKSDLRIALAARLTKARMDAGFKRRVHAIEKFKLSASTYAAHEAGRRSFNYEDAMRYANAFNVSVAHLMGHDLVDEAEIELREVPVVSIPIVGAAAAGLWLEGEDVSSEDIAHIHIPAVPGYPAEGQYARKVVGQSISNRIKSGEYAVILALEHYEGPISNDKVVDVCRHRSGLTEHTLKVLRNGTLHTDSAELKNQEELPLNHDDSDTSVEILGVAIAAYRTF